MWTICLWTIYTLVKIIVLILLLCFTCLICCLRLLEPHKGVCRCKTKLNGKIALITGGNSGIGFETAKDLAKRGARVIIASRDINRSEKAVADIKESTGNENVEHRYLNLGKFDSIKEFAESFNKNFDRLDILVNNAGCGSVKRVTTKDGIDLLMQINFVGPFLLTHLLLDKLIASKPSRIIIVSSYAHSFAKLGLEDITMCRTGNWSRYSNTKLCNILWTRELAKRLPEGVTVNALHPGIVKTNIFNNLNAYVKRIIFLIIDFLCKTPVEGAQTTIHLCVSPKLKEATGGYFVDCKKTELAKIAKDDKLSEMVWDKTMFLIRQ